MTRGSSNMDSSNNELVTDYYVKFEEFVLKHVHPKQII